MDIGWSQIWGTGVIAVGIYWIIRSNVPVGIEGRPPAFHAKGKWAVLLGIVAIVIGSIVALELPKQLKIDACLDSGGRYDYEQNGCDYGSGIRGG